MDFPKTSRWWLVGVAVCLLSSCSNHWVERWEPKEEGAFARARTAELVAGHPELVLAAVDPTVSAEDAQTGMKQVLDVLAAHHDTALKSMCLTAFMTQTRSTKGAEGIRQTSLTYLVTLAPSNAQVVINWQIKTDHGHLTITGLHAQAEGPPASVGEKVFSLLLACLVPVFCLVTFVVCLRTRIAHRKWLWALLTLVCVNLSWVQSASGGFATQMGGSLLGGLQFGPHGFFLSIPIGALVFWVRRRHLRALAVTPATPTPGSA